MNFAFLHQLDADYVHFELKVSPNLSLTHTDFAAVGWVAVLFLTPSPIVAKVLSTGCIYLAHFVASLVAANDGIAIQVQPFLDSLVLLYFLKKAITPVSYLMTLAIRFLLQYAVFTFLSNEVLSLEFPPYAKVREGESWAEGWSEATATAILRHHSATAVISSISFRENNLQLVASLLAVGLTNAITKKILIVSFFAPHRSSLSSTSFSWSLPSSLTSPSPFRHLEFLASPSLAVGSWPLSLGTR